MSENFENNDFSSETVSDVVSGVEKAPKKKTGVIVGGVCAGVVAVAAIGGVAAYNLSDVVKNKIKLATMKPAEYYSWVTETNAEKSAESAAESYKKYIDAISDGQSSGISVKYEASDDVKKLITDEMLGDDASGDEAQELKDIIENFNSVKAGIDISSKDGNASGTLFADYNDEKLISADIAVDSEALNLFARIPELNEKWLGISLSEAMEEAAGDEETEKVKAIITDFSENPEDYLTADELEKLMNKYTAVWCDQIKDVELEKKEKVDIADITVEYTVIKAEINEEKAYDIASAYIDTVSKDELVKEIVTERLELCTADEFDEALKDAAESLEDSKDDIDSDSDETVTLTTYVDATGTIRGMDITVPASETDDEETTSSDEGFSFIIGLDGDKLCGEMKFSADGEEFTGELNAEKKGKKYTGDIELKAEEGTISIEFADFEIVDEEKGYVNCDLSIIIPDMDPIALSLSSDGKSQDIAFDLAIEGTNYGTFTLNMSTDKADDINVPAADDAFMIDPEASDINIEDYVTEDDITAFASELLQKIGFSKDTTDMLMEYAVGSMNSGYDDYDYDYDYDDDDYNFDDDDFDVDYDDNDYDDYNYEDDDLDFSDNQTNEDNPDASNAVSAENGFAYLSALDLDWEAEYWGDAGDSLSYNAGVAEIKGDGTYTVSVTADTDGYRYATTGNAGDKSVMPNGLDYLSVCINDADDKFANAIIKIDSVKIDGKEVAVTGENLTSTEYSYIEGFVYTDWYEPESPRCESGDTSKASTSVIDGASIAEWTTIEVTFTVKGA